MPHADDRTPGLANALFGPRLGRPVFVAARTSTPLPMSVTDPATTFRELCSLRGERQLQRADALGAASVADQARYLILVSLKATCLRAIGSYFLKDSFSVAVRGFFLVT